MEVDFDKEIDALLRQTARTGEAAFADSKFQVPNSKSPHLDADEISAFAENALPEKMKLLFTAHFADCDRCRKILSNVVALNSETQTETARGGEIKLAAPVVIPWYKRLFATPNPAYAMGALVLVFAGLIGFTFLKNTTQTAEVSQIKEKPVNMGGASSDGETVTTETASAPTNSMSNGGSSMMSNAASMSNSMQSNSAMTRDGFSSNAASMSNGASLSSNAGVNAQSAVKNKSQTAEPATTPSEPNENLGRSANFAEQKQSLVDKEKTRAPENEDKLTDNSSVAAPKPAPKTDAPAPPPAKSSGMNTRSATTLSADSAQDKKNARRAETENVETRKVGDKNFQRKGGVWYDAAYNGQSTTNVARGTESYRKLDSGLRSIAETLSGTIVVLWKSKAYRIQ